MAENTRSLLRGEITYSFAKDEEVNILHRLGYVEQRARFFNSLHRNQGWMKAVVAHHLGLRSPESCNVANLEDWIHGSFNVCIPVTISSGWRGKSQRGDRLMLRVPLPYRVGDGFRPGNGDEKLRCEAGTYAWFQQNSADVPIPQLYGFALSTGETFTALGCLPFWKRGLFKLKCLVLSWFGRPLPSNYLRHQCMAESGNMDTGYLLIEYIEQTQGQMLSNAWSEQRHDPQLRSNFFHSLARILLSITRVKLPRIGSFIIDNNGYLQLANRPLSYVMQDFENEHIPTDIPRDCVYSMVQSYVMDTLRVHDNRIIYQPNAINNPNDYSGQTAILTTMRAVLASFFNPDLRRGPFVLTLTDFNQSNIFIDKNWNITCLVDLEWICSKPIEMFHLPTWLTCKAVDEIAEEHEEYGTIRQELVDAIAAEEEKLLSKPAPQENPVDPRLSTIMNQSWKNGTFWYSLALGSPTGIWAIFRHQIQPRFLRKCSNHEGFHNVVPWYWSTDFVEMAVRKLNDKKNYDIQLRESFGLGPEDPDDAQPGP